MRTLVRLADFNPENPRHAPLCAVLHEADRFLINHWRYEERLYDLMLEGQATRESTRLAIQTIMAECAQNRWITIAGPAERELAIIAWQGIAGLGYREHTKLTGWPFDYEVSEPVIKLRDLVWADAWEEDISRQIQIAHDSIAGHLEHVAKYTPDVILSDVLPRTPGRGATG